MNSTKHLRLILMTWLALASLSVGAVAQVPQVDRLLTPDEVGAKLQELEDSTAADKAVLIELYGQVLDALGDLDAARARTSKFRAEQAEAPTLLEAFREQLANPAPEPELVLEPGTTLEELQARLQQAQAELDASRDQGQQLEELADHRSGRNAALPDEIASAQQLLTESQETLSATPQGLDQEARRNLLLAQIEAYRAEVVALEAERDSYEARRELLPLRRDRAVRRLALAQKATDFWREQVELLREQEGEAAAEAAAQQLDLIMRQFPELEDLAAKNRELAVLRSGDSGLPRKIAEAQSDLEAAQESLDQASGRFRAARRRITAGGLTEAMGLTLRRDYEWLPRAAALEAESEARDLQLSEAELLSITIDEERLRVGDLATATEKLLARIGGENPSEQLQLAAAELLTKHRASQDAVLAELGVLTSTLYERQGLARELEQEVQGYRGFIEKRILWVRSSPTNPLISLFALPAHAVALAQTDLPRSLYQGLKQSMKTHAIPCFLLGLVVLGLLLTRRTMKKSCEEKGASVRSFRTDRYLFTLQALAQTLLLALPMPLLAWSFGWLLMESQVNELVNAVGSGLCEVAQVWLVLRFLSGMVQRKGVGAQHFKWPESSMTAVRKELFWYEPLAVVLGLVIFSLDRQNVTEWSDSIGRLCFVTAMLSLSFLLQRLLSQKSYLWTTSVQMSKGLFSRAHGLWSVLATVVPILLAVLASCGYYYTALQFELRLRYSIGFASALVLINALLLRWLYVTRRRLAVSQALEAKAKREKEAEEEGLGEISDVAVDADKVDIPAVDARTRQLFKSSIRLATVLGLYLIWSSALPALQGLDRVQLLPHFEIKSADATSDSAPNPVSTPASTTTVTSEAPSPNSNSLPDLSGEEIGQSAGLLEVLNLADVFLALLFLLLTTVAARNLPALLELSLLQRLPLDSGSRYAVATLVRYVILLAGVSAISGALNIGWQQIQWLAAALTFGLAFGLQEIFANFVSGLIILIERPVRVGDIVTVGSTEGRITQLRMRATTILDWDRKEYLVPNKEFITGSVVNWTLSDPLTRVIIPVGIAYGSDTQKTKAILLQVACNNSHVIKDPGPEALFRSFGDSTLDFELRVFVANRDMWPTLIDELHMQVDAAFAKAGIEIAFPQRDLHIRSVEGANVLGASS